MKTDLTSTLKTQGWSISLVAVFAGVLALFGVALDQVYARIHKPGDLSASW